MMISQQLYQAILPPHLRARVVLQVTRGYHPRPTDVRIARIIVVFQMPHEGGVLITRHRGQEWPFDTAAAAALSATPPFSVTPSTEPASSPAQLAVDEQGFRSAFRRFSRLGSSSLRAVCSALGCGTYIRSRAVGGSSTSTVCRTQGERCNHLSSRPRAWV